MSTAEAVAIQQTFQQRMAELRAAVSRVPENRADQPMPGSEWSVKETLSHLLDDSNDYWPACFQRILREDTPRFDIVLGRTCLTPERRGLTSAQLLAAVEAQYGKVAALIGGLGAEQLQRKAHIPFLAQFGNDAYPTLQAWVDILVNMHVTDHISQIK